MRDLKLAEELFSPLHLPVVTEEKKTDKLDTLAKRKRAVRHARKKHQPQVEQP